ncbi:conserved hypothetical protein [Neospora caninum Liverpool]|uniref:Uncharacterized protein n=1 Tax=Neospora caninum (strain Liverpool) TaxID=572307 RepID=F0VE73_NEOCL|nr:conserved hypothetical protein [Neospora caninum Liverpool]CBZ52017.1 conserved hypothetical protein [Neospora caninum Liverpool]CEL65978.1 TPA: hypothetical protein BN1204_018070 [Neospora caninum Liverpool]|eukprot:XP_003882049.1 conserved hypothetical protein [Neospora caninum Liverpool]
MPCSSNDTGAGGSWVDTLTPAAFLVSPVPLHSTSSSREHQVASLSSGASNGQRQAASRGSLLAPASSQAVPASDTLRVAPDPALCSQPSPHLPSQIGLVSQRAVKWTESHDDGHSLTRYNSAQSFESVGSERDVYLTPTPSKDGVVFSPNASLAEGPPARRTRGGDAAVQREGVTRLESGSSQEATFPASSRFPESPERHPLRLAESAGSAVSAHRESQRDVSDTLGSHGGAGDREVEGGNGGVLFFTPISSPVKIRSFSSSADAAVAIRGERRACERGDGVSSSQSFHGASKGSDSGSVDWTAMCSRTYTPKLGLLQKCCDETDTRNEEDENDDSDATLSSLPEASGATSRSIRPFASGGNVCTRANHLGGEPGCQVYRRPGNAASSRFALRHPCQRPLCWKRSRKLERRLRRAWHQDFPSDDPFDLDASSSAHLRALLISSPQESRRLRAAGERDSDRSEEATSGQAEAAAGEHAPSQLRPYRHPARPRRASGSTVHPQRGAGDVPWPKKTDAFEGCSVALTSSERKSPFWERHGRKECFGEGTRDSRGDQGADRVQDTGSVAFEQPSGARRGRGTRADVGENGHGFSHMLGQRSAVELDHASEEGSPLFVSPVTECLLEPEESCRIPFPLGPAAGELVSLPSSPPTIGAGAPQARGSVSLRDRPEETGTSLQGTGEDGLSQKQRRDSVSDFFTPTSPEHEREGMPSLRRRETGAGGTGASVAYRRRSLGPGGWEKFEEEDSEESEVSCQRGIKKRCPPSESPEIGSKSGPPTLHSTHMWVHEDKDRQSQPLGGARLSEGDNGDRRLGNRSGLSLVRAAVKAPPPTWHAWAEATSDEELDHEDRRLPKRRRFSVSTLEPQSSSEEDMVSVEKGSTVPTASPPRVPPTEPAAPSVPVSSAPHASLSSLPAEPSSSVFSPLPPVPGGPQRGKEEAAIAALLAAPPPPPPPFSRLLRKRKRHSTGGVARRMRLHGPGFAGPGLPSADEATLVNSLGTALTAEETQELRQREKEERVRHQMLEKRRKEEEARAAEIARLQKKTEAEKAAVAAACTSLGAAAKPAGAHSGLSSPAPQFVFGANRPDGDASSGKPNAAPASAPLGKAEARPSGAQLAFGSGSGALPTSTEKPTETPGSAGVSGAAAAAPVLVPGQRRPRLTIVRPSASGNQAVPSTGVKNALGTTPGGGTLAAAAPAPAFGGGSGPAVAPKPSGAAGVGGAVFGVCTGAAGGTPDPGASSLWGRPGSQGPDVGSTGSGSAGDGLLPGFGSAALGPAGASGASLAFGAGLVGAVQDGGAGAAGGANPFAFQRGGRGPRGMRGRGGRRR